MPPYNIAIIPGDGVGREVIPAGWRVVRAAAERHASRALEGTEFPWSCEYYRRTGRMMDADALGTLDRFDAIYLGAIGSPEVPDHVSVWGLILPIRQQFDQYVNLRPIRLLPGIVSPLAGRSAADIDMVCVRENSEGEYIGKGFLSRGAKGEDVAEQTGVFTRHGIDRIARYAFELARRRRESLAPSTGEPRGPTYAPAAKPRGRVTSATKSNALQYSFVLWDEVVTAVARDFPDLPLDKCHVDALAARMVTHPQHIDVIVASNLFGDILTDLGAAIQGGMGLAASGNLNPSRTHPSMFEPIHGSAPDIAGRAIANPIGAIWAGALMLEHLGEDAAARAVMQAVEAVTARGTPRTPDLGGTATTEQVAAAIVEEIRRDAYGTLK